MDEIYEIYRRNFPYINRDQNTIKKVIKNDNNIIFEKRENNNLIACAIVNKNTISHPIIVKEKRISLTDEGEENEEIIDSEPVKEEKEGFEQISIFDDLDE